RIGCAVRPEVELAGCPRGFREGGITGMLTSPGFGFSSVNRLRFLLILCHKLLVSCPACFLEQDKIKSGVAHILESHPREQHARVDCIRTKAPTPEYLSVEDQRSWGKKEPSYDHCRL